MSNRLLISDRPIEMRNCFDGIIMPHQNKEVVRHILMSSWVISPPYRIWFNTLKNYKYIVDEIEYCLRTSYGFKIDKIWEVNCDGEYIEHPTKGELLLFLERFVDCDSIKQYT